MFVIRLKFDNIYRKDFLRTKMNIDNLIRANQSGLLTDDLISRLSDDHGSYVILLCNQYVRFSGRPISFTLNLQIS